jgi:hypothetical protein
MNENLEMILKEAESWNLPGGTEENNEKPHQAS